MPPFRFRLEQVLRYRIQLEDQAKQAFALAQASFAAQQEQTAKLQAILAEQNNHLANPTSLTIDELWLVRQYAAVVQYDLNTSLAQEHQLQEACDQCRVDLTQKARDRKLLDKLKEKQAGKHSQEQHLIEQRVYDETATIRSQHHSF